jgi:hypothetical protein
MRNLPVKKTFLSATADANHLIHLSARIVFRVQQAHSFSGPSRKLMDHAGHLIHDSASQAQLENVE